MKPNIQNIPVRAPEGRRVSEAFRKPLLSGNYASTEHRMHNATLAESLLRSLAIYGHVEIRHSERDLWHASGAPAYLLRLCKSPKVQVPKRSRERLERYVRDGVGGITHTSFRWRP